MKIHNCQKFEKIYLLPNLTVQSLSIQIALILLPGISHQINGQGDPLVHPKLLGDQSYELSTYRKICHLKVVGFDIYNADLYDLIVIWNMTKDSNY